MKRIIVNADDYGLNTDVNSYVAHFMEQHFVSSTSVLANGADLEWVVNMYNLFPDISHGVHLNLTEGEPLTASQLLLDIGFYREENGTVYFNGRKFFREWLNKEARSEILKELTAQVNLLRDLGIELSHIDSHHHIHTSFFMYLILPELCDRVNIHRVRNIRNCYSWYSWTQMTRRLWRMGVSARNGRIQFPDMFCDLKTFVAASDVDKTAFSSYDVVELECHPSRVVDGLDDEELCKKMTIARWNNRRLASYWDL